MIIPLEKYQHAWRLIKQESLSHSTYKIVVFVSCFDVDAFAASAMLSLLLQKHLVLYKTVPLTGYKAFKSEFSRLDSSINNVILVGFGAGVDLEDYLEMDDDSPKIHIFDARRPWNLNNLFGNDKLFCYEDDDERLNVYKDAYEKLQPGSDTEEDEESTQLLEEYYLQGTSQSTTSAISMYTLLTMVGETTIKTLWLAIVGLTSIEPYRPRLYKLLLPALLDELKRFNQHDIYAEPDYSLFLLRQWCLYDSMIHSSYISSKLYLWREEGRKTLHKLLAEIGVTLQDSKESWLHINPNLRRDLRGKLDGISSRYQIQDITRRGVVRQYGLNGIMSAGDVVEAIAAILETAFQDSANPVTTFTKPLKPKPKPVPRVIPRPNPTNVGSLPMTGRDQYEQASLDEQVEEEKEEEEDQQDLWVKNFWTAWDAFDDFDLMKDGIEKAKTIQRSVVSTANFIFENNLPKDFDSFRMVIVQDAPELPVFMNPLSLQRLAIWVFEGCAELNTRQRPLVLAILDEERHIYMVYGMAGRVSRDEQYSNNHFGRLFQYTASKINARIRVDTFDSSIIELSRDDLPRFLEALNDI